MAARARSNGDRLSRLAALAWPTVLSRAGILVMALVDVAMLGRYDTDALAAAFLSYSMVIPFLVTGVGLQFGAFAMISQAYGAGDERACGVVWRRAIAWAVAVGLVGTAIAATAPWVFAAVGHEPGLAREAGAVALALAPSVFLQMIYVACAFYLEGTQRPIAGLVAIVLANLLNVVLNYALIFGEWGAPELGAVGSGLATTAARGISSLFLLIVVLRFAAPERFGVRLEGPFWGEGGWVAGARMRALGFAGGASIALETGYYAFLSQLAGFLGADTLAAFGVAHQVEAVFYMAAIGLGSAAGAMVGAAIGVGDRMEARRVASTALVLGAVVLSACGAALWLFSGPTAALFIGADAPVVRAGAAALFAIVSVLLVFDGLQYVASLCVRATGDGWAATGRHAAAYWAVGAPLSAALCFWLGLGVDGLLIGAVAACAASLALQTQRFRRLTEHDPLKDGAA